MVKIGKPLSLRKKIIREYEAFSNRIILLTRDRDEEYKANRTSERYIRLSQQIDSYYELVECLEKILKKEGEGAMLGQSGKSNPAPTEEENEKEFK